MNMNGRNQPLPKLCEASWPVLSGLKHMRSYTVKKNGSSPRHPLAVNGIGTTAGPKPTCRTDFGH